MISKQTVVMGHVMFPGWSDVGRAACTGCSDTNSNCRDKVDTQRQTNLMVVKDQARGLGPACYS